MFVGIPTRDRPTRSANLADAIAPHVEQVVLVYRGTQPNPRQQNVSLISGGKTLQEARNFLLTHAVLRDDLASHQVDDDIVVPDWGRVFNKFEEVLTQYPWVGAVGTCPQFYWGMGAKNAQSNTGFQVVAAVFQLWAIRCAAFKEAGRMDLETMEDLEYGYRLWSKGWAVARLLGIDYVHGTSVPRLGKRPDQGGQPVEERNEHLPKGVLLMAQRYPQLANIGLVTPRPGARRMATHYNRPNWPLMLQQVRQRWGQIGYRDSNDRTL